MRHKFRHFGIDKEGFTNGVLQNDSGKNALEPSDFYIRILEFFNAKKLKMSKSQLAELFQHFSLNEAKQVDLSKAVDCLFNEEYADFIDRHNLNPRLAHSEILKEDEKENEQPNKSGSFQQSCPTSGQLPFIKTFGSKLLANNKGLYSAFKQVDADKDGFISRADLKSYLNDKGTFSEAEIDQLFDFFGQRENGMISFSAFGPKLCKTENAANLAEEKCMTNIFGLKQFDPKSQLQKMKANLLQMEQERDKFRLLDPKENCGLKRFLWEK